MVLDLILDFGLQLGVELVQLVKRGGRPHLVGLHGRHKRRERTDALLGLGNRRLRFGDLDERRKKSEKDAQARALDFCEGAYQSIVLGLYLGQLLGHVGRVADGVVLRLEAVYDAFSANLGLVTREINRRRRRRVGVRQGLLWQNEMCPGQYSAGTEPHH